MKKIIFSEEVNKFIYYINYERGRVISEQGSSLTMGTDSYDPNEKERIKKVEKEQYPKYCKYYDRAIYPKIKGISSKESLIDGYCCYPVPSTTQIGGTVAMYVPKDMGLTFWNKDEDYISFAKQVQEEYPNVSVGDFNFLVQNLIKILPKGTIRQLHGSERFTTKLMFDSGMNLWLFKGFIGAKSGKLFPQPKWVDERSEYDKFLDEHGLALQLTAALGTIIITLATGGVASPLLVFSEILIEGSIGIAVAQREYEKGEHITAAFSFLTALLPIMKAKNIWNFRGVSVEELESLSKSIIDGKLGYQTTEVEFENFMKGLNDKDRKTLLKVLDYDEYSAKDLIKIIEKNGGELANELIIQDMKQVLKKQPKILKSIPFFEKLWARELRANAIVVIIGAVTNITLGKVLNSKDKEILKGYYNIVPDELKKEIAYNLLSNAEDINKILPELSNITETLKQKNIDLAKKASEYINSKTQEVFQKNGLKYTELPEDSTTATNNLKTIQEREKQLREMGFVPESEASPDCQNLDSTELNGVQWFLC